MILALDAGNSRLKWGVFDLHGTLVSYGVVTYDAWEQFPLPLWQSCHQVVISCVADSHVEQYLRQELTDFKIHWIRATSAACGVLNGYQTPGQLGSDRWAALVGARCMYQDTALLVHVGTALVIDMLLSTGEFAGGVILPGVRLQQQALQQGAAQLSAMSGKWHEQPRNTGDAMYSGVLHSMAGAVERMYRQLQQISGEVTPLCLIAGGDAEKLTPLLPHPWVATPHLVLQGLWYLGRAAP